MNQSIAFLIFFSIFFTIYFLVNIYIYRHTRHLLSGRRFRKLLKWFFLAVVLSYPLGRILERLWPSVFTFLMVKAGSIWLAAMLYLTISFLLIDIVRIVMWAGRIPLLKRGSRLLLTFRQWGYITTVLLVFAGYINALYPKVNRVEIDIPRPVEGYSRLRVGVASDIHLGTIIGYGRLKRLVRMMNAGNPDIILLAGDIFDEDLGPVLRNDMGSLLSELEAPLGVWAVTGNHEFIGGAEEAVAFLEKNGIRVLRDRVASPGGVFHLIGREDLRSDTRYGIRRKPLDELLEGLDPDILTILMDHQPARIQEAIDTGIDLQVSGHSHHGQLWPFSYITRAMFMVSRGHGQFNNTHVFVSTGFGTWGPPVRIGNRPEIAVITINTGS